MAILLDEQCIRGLIGMPDALEAVEEVFRAQGNGEVYNVPRVRAPVKGGIVRITAAVLSYRGYYGVKISSTAVFGSNAGRMFCLYKEDTGELCAIVQVFAMGALRTGAGGICSSPKGKTCTSAAPSWRICAAMCSESDVVSVQARSTWPVTQR